MATEQSPLASRSQIEYLRALAGKRAVWGLELDRAATIAKMEEVLPTITRAEASTLIDRTKYRAPHHPVDQVPATMQEIRRLREAATERALFGLTYDRDQTIARIEDILATDFVSQASVRAALRLINTAPPHPTAQTPLRLSDIEGLDNLSISEGFYAVFDTHDVLRYYRIYTPASGANKGVGVIRRFAGDNLMGLYPAEAKTALESIDADPDVSAYRFSDTFARCWACGKALTDAISRLVSVGPTCRGFSNHAGLRTAAQDVDHNPERRLVYRALRDWAKSEGFTDPRNPQERAAHTMTASRLASAWSGVPGILTLNDSEAVALISSTVRGTLTNANYTFIREGLLAAPADTLAILIESGVLPVPVMEVLAEHPKKAVREATAEFFLSQLGR